MCLQEGIWWEGKEEWCIIKQIAYSLKELWKKHGTQWGNFTTPEESCWDRACLAKDRMGLGNQRKYPSKEMQIDASHQESLTGLNWKNQGKWIHLDIFHWGVLTNSTSRLRVILTCLFICWFFLPGRLNFIFWNSTIFFPVLVNSVKNTIESLWWFSLLPSLNADNMTKVWVISSYLKNGFT